MAYRVTRMYKGMVNGDLLEHVDNPVPPPDLMEYVFPRAFNPHALFTQNWRPRTPFTIDMAMYVPPPPPPTQTWTPETLQTSTWTPEVLI